MSSRSRPNPKGQIYWRSLITGQTGHGEIIDLEAARTWVDSLNEDKDLNGKVIHYVTVIELEWRLEQNE